MGREIEVGIQGVDTDANTRCSMKMAEANKCDTQLGCSTDRLGQAKGQCSATLAGLAQLGWRLHIYGLKHRNPASASW